MAKNKKTKFTKQQTFNKIISGLVKQGRAAYDPDKGCQYLTADGDKCAAGQLIPKGKYKSSMEGKNLYSNDIRRLFKSFGHNTELVMECQVAHDNVEPGEPFSSVIGGLIEVGAEFGLRIPKSLLL